MAAVSQGRFAAFRLRPGDDLIEGLRDARARTGAEALAVVTCVGSLTEVRLRYAGQDDGTHLTGPFEIVSLVGTVDPGHRHLHIGIADAQGRMSGGHLLPGAVIHTTAELVVALLDDLSFRRVPCPASGYGELVVEGPGMEGDAEAPERTG